MFTVKATYRSEIRKFTFDSTSFPTFDQLCTHLRRVFTSSSKHYLSKLLFSPDASKPGRILVAQQVHNADDYAKCLLPFKGRHWPNALLRFDVLDEPYRPTDILTKEQQRASQSPDSRSPTPTPIVSFPPPISSFFIPPPPIMFSAPRTYTTSARSSTALVDVPDHNSRPPSSHSSFTRPPQYPRSTDSCCCSLAQSKVEIQGLVQNFQKDLDRMLNSTFGRSYMEPSTAPSSPSDWPPTAINNCLLRSPPPPSLSCSLCSISLTGRWYTCRECHARVCLECHLVNRSNFCVVTLGAHVLESTSPYLPAGSLSSPPWVAPPSWMIPSRSPSEIEHPLPTQQTPHGSSFHCSRSMNASPPIEPFIPPLRVPTPIDQPPQINLPPPPQSSAPVNPPPPPPVIHQGVRCDACGATIEGVRHKCLDCPDYDLCTPCISYGALERHDTNHQFLDLNEPTRVVVHTLYQNDGNAAPAIHNATCDLCDSLIHGDRYKCTSCPDFDTCTACFSITQEQHPKHSFVKLSNPASYIRRHTSHPVQHLATCNVCSKTIYGIRYKCMHMLCPDFDLCASCEALPIPQHPDNHPMLKMKSNDAIIPTVYRSEQMYGSYPQGTFDSSSFVVPPTRTPVNSNSNSSTPDAVRRDPVLNISPMSDLPTPDLAKSLHPPIQVTGFAISDGKPPCPVSASIKLASNSPSPVFLPITRLLSEQVLVPSLGTDVADDMQEISSASATTDKSPGATSDDKPSCHAPASVRLVSNSPTPVSLPVMRLLSEQALVPSPLVPSLVVDLANDVQEIPSASATTDKSPGATTVLRAPNSLPQVGLESPTESYEDCLDSQSNSEVSSNVPHSAPLFGGFEMQLSHISDLCLYNDPLLKSPPTPEPAEVQSPSVQFARLSTLSLSGLLDACRLVSDPAWSEKERRLSASFLQCTTVPDGSTLAPGVTFVKRWKLLNDGTCEWPEATEVVSVGGASFAGGHLASRVGAVKPGECKEISTTELKAPDRPGKYTSYWSLRDDKLHLFGPSIWVEIEVVEPSGPNCNENLSSSSIIVMPDIPQAPVRDLLGDQNTDGAAIEQRDDTDEDDMSDSSSVSMVSLPTSDDEDAALWTDSRRQVTTEHGTDYVLLYDDNTSDED